MEKTQSEKALLICPITQKECYESSCAWWVKGCAIVESLFYLENISDWCVENYSLKGVIR